MRKPLYPLGQSYEMAKFKRCQDRKPLPPITDELLEKATSAACARYLGGIGYYPFIRRMATLASECGFDNHEDLECALAYDSRATWPFTGYVPEEWERMRGVEAPQVEKILPNGKVIR